MIYRIGNESGWSAFACRRCQGGLRHASRQEVNRKIGINAARIKYAEAMEE